MVSDLRSILQVAQGKQGQPCAVTLDGRTLQSTCESGSAPATMGTTARLQGPMAVATCWQQERAQVRSLAQDVQHVAGETMKPAFVDQDYTGQSPAEATQEEGGELHVLKLAEAKKGVVLLCVAGSWSAVSVGSIGSGAWPVTTNAHAASLLPSS